MTTDEIKIGMRVRSLCNFACVPRGTYGIVDAFDGEDIVVAWDLPHNPLPKGYQEYDGRPAIASGIIRDWFNPRELKLLEVAE